MAVARHHGESVEEETTSSIAHSPDEEDGNEKASKPRRTWQEAAEESYEVPKVVLAHDSAHDEQKNVVPSDDFHSVRWGNELFTFTTKQAGCVEALYENWKRGTPVLAETTILGAAGSDAARLRDIFDTGKHPAWHKMIVSDRRKGLFKLADP